MSVRLYAPGTRKGNRYWIARISIDGRRIEVSTASGDKAASRVWAREFERKLRDGGPPRPGEAVSFARAADVYLAYRDPTVADRKRVGRLKAALGLRLVSEIRQADLVDAATRLYPKGAAATRNREAIRPAAAILHYAEKNGWCEYLRVGLFKEPRPRTRALSIEAAQTFVNTASPDLRLLLLWLFRQGDRISDALRVTWPDIDLSAGTVQMRISKTDRWRTAALHPELIEALANAGKREGYLFRWRTRSGVYKPLRALSKAIGLKMTPHMARHSMATWLNDRGVSLRTIMAAGGWQDIKSVIRYADADVEQVRAANELLPRIAGGKAGEYGS